MAPISARRRCATMTDASGTGPPEKRERRPGQEAATLGKTGKMNSSDNATNGAVLSPAIGATPQPMSIPRWASRLDDLSSRADLDEVCRWLAEHAATVFPALLSRGNISAAGRTLRVDTIEVT